MNMKTEIKLTLIGLFTFLAFASFDSNPLSLTPPLLIVVALYLGYSIKETINQDQKQDNNDLKNLDK